MGFVHSFNLFLSTGQPSKFSEQEPRKQQAKGGKTKAKECAGSAQFFRYTLAARGQFSWDGMSLVSVVTKATTYMVHGCSSVDGCYF